MSRSSLRDLQLAYAARSAVFNERVQRLATAKARLAELIKLTDTQKEAILLASKCLERTLELKEVIEKVTSEGLTEILGQDYVYKLEPVYDTAIKNDTSIKGLRELVSKNGSPFEAPSEYGDSAIEIIDFCHRLVILGLSEGTIKLLIIDEPGRGISDGLWPALQSYAARAGKQLGVQIVFVTHHSQPFGRVYTVAMDDKGVSHVELLRE